MQTSTVTLVATGRSTASTQGTDYALTGEYSQSESSVDSLTTLENDSNQTQSVSVSQVTTPTVSTVQTGDNITGSYSLSEIDTSGGTAWEQDSNQTQYAALTTVLSDFGQFAADGERHRGRLQPERDWLEHCPRSRSRRRTRR